MIAKTCQQCARVFYVRPTRDNTAKYCSYRCHWDAVTTRRETKCVICHKPILATPRQISMGKRFCSQRCRGLSVLGTTINSPVAILHPTISDIHWLAGFAEGEASFGRGRTETMAIAQTNPQPLTKVANLFGGSVNPRHFTHREGRIKSKDQFLWRAYAARARGIMMTIYPLMSARRQSQIRTALGKS